MDHRPPHEYRTNTSETPFLDAQMRRVIFDKAVDKSVSEGIHKLAINVQVGGDHYKTMAIQPIEYCLKNNIPFAEGNVIKYVSRWRNKGGVADLKKARHMLDVLIEAEESLTVTG